MMPEIVWAVSPVVALAALGGVYVFSRDAGRRRRALDLMRIMLGRRVDAGLADRDAVESATVNRSESLPPSPADRS